MSKEIIDARKTIREHFEKSVGFKQTYISNITGLICDELHITDDKGTEVAEKILNLIFYSK